MTDQKYLMFSGWTVRKVTEKAIQVEHDDFEEPVWLPLSRVILPDDYVEKGDEIVFALPVWLAVEKQIDELGAEDV